MAKCPFCDHFNRTGATQCEECRAPLQTSIPKPSDVAQSPMEPAPEPGSLDAEILGLMQGGKKIDAIKLCRQRTNVGLKEAKDFVEALAARHGINPNSGCGSAVLLMLTAGALLTGAVCAFAAIVH